MVTSMKIRTRILSILRKFGSSIRVLPSFRSLVHAYTRNLPQNITSIQRGRRYEYFKERNFTRIVTPRGIFQFFCFAYSRYRYKLCTRVLTGRERYIFPYVFFFVRFSTSSLSISEFTRQILFTLHLIYVYVRVYLYTPHFVLLASTFTRGRFISFSSLFRLVRKEVFLTRPSYLAIG